MFSQIYCAFYLRPGCVIWIFVIVCYSIDPCYVLDSDNSVILSTTSATYIGHRFCTMTSEKKCCVPNCGSEKEILHKFPNPNKDIDRFRTWLYNIGGDILALDNETIFKCRRVCHMHFEPRYHTRSKFLSADAIPRLNLLAPSKTRPSLVDITNQGCSTSSSSEIPFLGESNVSKRQETANLLEAETDPSTSSRKRNSDVSLSSSVTVSGDGNSTNARR